MNFKEKQLIIFDLDGTLVNSIPDLAEATNRMLVQFNLLPLSVEEVTGFIGNGAKVQVKKALEYSMSTRNISGKILKEAFDIYMSSYKKVICDKTYLYDGVLETLEYLNNNGYKMVICTNKPFYFIEPILEKLVIKKFFKYWIGGDSLPESKPNPSPLIYLSNKMDVTIDKCIMVGDSKNDILAAQNSEMDCVGLTYGYNYNENIADYNPTIVLDEFNKLQKLL